MTWCSTLDIRKGKSGFQADRPGGLVSTVPTDSFARIILATRPSPWDRANFCFGNFPCPIGWSSRVTMCRISRIWIRTAWRPVAAYQRVHFRGSRRVLDAEDVRQCHRGPRRRGQSRVLEWQCGILRYGLSALLRGTTRPDFATDRPVPGGAVQCFRILVVRNTTTPEWRSVDGGTALPWWRWRRGLDLLQSHPLGVRRYGHEKRRFDPGPGRLGMAFESCQGFAWHGVVAEETDDALTTPDKPMQIATIYDGPKDNVVLNAASIWWAQGLSSPPGHMLPAWNAKPQGPDPRVQRMMSNVFNRFIK